MKITGTLMICDGVPNTLGWAFNKDSLISELPIKISVHSHDGGGLPLPHNTIGIATITMEGDRLIYNAMIDQNPRYLSEPTYLVGGFEGFYSVNKIVSKAKLRFVSIDFAHADDRVLPALIMEAKRSNKDMKDMKEVKPTSVSQKVILSQINRKGKTGIFYVDSRMFRAAKTLIKKYPHLFKFERSKFTQDRLDKGEVVHAIGYQLVKVTNEMEKKHD